MLNLNPCLFCYSPGNRYQLCSDCEDGLPFFASNVVSKRCKICLGKIEQNILSFPIDNVESFLRFSSIDVQECFACFSNKPYYDQVFSLFEYQNIIRNLISDFKFRNHIHLAHLWANLLAIRAPKDFFLMKPTLVPVPLHYKKLAERGYNQSLLIARLLKHKLGLPLSINLIKKVLNTRAQSSLNKEERKYNLAQAFTMHEFKSMPDNVIIIDDVMTTGATINFLSKEFKRFGVTSVRILTIARG